MPTAAFLFFAHESLKGPTYSVSLLRLHRWTVSVKTRSMYCDFNWGAETTICPTPLKATKTEFTQFRHMKDFPFFSDSLPCVLAGILCLYIPFHFDHFKYMTMNSQAVGREKSVSLAYAMNHLAPIIFISFVLNCVFLLLLTNLFLPCSHLL